MAMPGRNFYFLAFSLCILAEVCFNVCFSQVLGQGFNSIGFFCTSLAIGIMTIAYGYGKKELTTDRQTRVWPKVAIMLTWATLIVIFCLNIASTLKDAPVNLANSDIIPTITIGVKRFVAGEFVYAPINHGDHISYTYLPAQWLPFCIAELFRFDYRWVPIILTALVGLWLIRRAMKGHFANGLLIGGLLLFNYTFIRKFEDGVFINTVEIMIAGYYMAFIAGIGTKNALLKGFLISLCLLSRYSLVLWLPLWLFVEFFSGDRRKLMLTLLMIGLCVCCIYIIPFLSHDWLVFSKYYPAYSSAALGEWQHQNERGLPMHLYNGQGLAWLFYEQLKSHDLPYRIKCLQQVHLMMSLGSVAAMGAWYWFNRNRVERRIFLMGSFKIYLSIFLAFIQVPYAYLMITGSFVSIAILAELMRYKTSPSTGQEALSV